MPERLHHWNSPKWADYDDERDWQAARDAWNTERSAYCNPLDPGDDQLDVLCQPISGAQFAILDTPAATVTDIERKLSVVADLARERMLHAEWIEGVLSDVKRINGSAAARLAQSA